MTIPELEQPGREPAPKNSERVDRIGAVASSLCAVHCALVALLPAALGALGLGALLGHEAEWVFTLIAVAFAGGALFLGWRRHRSSLVAGLLVLGIVGLLASRGIEMSSGHHDEHGESHHHAEEHTTPSEFHTEGAGTGLGQEGYGHEDSGHEDSAGAHEAHGDTAHLAGTGVGVFGGLLLLLGHILNIRAGRRRREEQCEDC